MDKIVGRRKLFFAQPIITESFDAAVIARWNKAWTHFVCCTWIWWFARHFLRSTHCGIQFKNERKKEWSGAKMFFSVLRFSLRLDNCWFICWTLGQSDGLQFAQGVHLRFDTSCYALKSLCEKRVGPTSSSLKHEMQSFFGSFKLSTVGIFLWFKNVSSSPFVQNYSDGKMVVMRPFLTPFDIILEAL